MLLRDLQDLLLRDLQLDQDLLLRDLQDLLLRDLQLDQDLLVHDVHRRGFVEILP